MATSFFGLALLRPEYVGDSFTEDLIPKDKSVETLADYVLSTYIVLYRRQCFVSTLCIPSTARRTNNGPEAFHSHYNKQFYASHPSMFVFLDNIKIRTTTYIKLRSTNTDAVKRRHNSEKETVVLEKYRKFER